MRVAFCGVRGSMPAAGAAFARDGVLLPEPRPVPAALPAAAEADGPLSWDPRSQG
jgi:hypothetical protein